MDIQSQNQHIYRLFLDGGSITNLEAVTKHGIGRCASRINELINDYGVPVVKTWETNQAGARYTRYSMSKEDQQRLANISLRDVHSITKLS